MMEKRTTEQLTYTLDVLRVIKLPHRINNLVVTSFDGNPGQTFLQFSPSVTSSSRQYFRNKASWDWEGDALEVWIYNSVAQPGKTLTIICGTAGVKVTGGAAVTGLENVSGVAINPATADNQNDIKGLLVDPATATKQDVLKTYIDTVSFHVLEIKGILQNRGDTTLDHITVGTTSIVLPDVTIPAGFGVRLKAAASNTGIIYIGRWGGASVSTGYPLSAGESVTLYLSNLYLIFVIADAAAQTLCYIAEI